LDVQISTASFAELSGVLVAKRSFEALSLIWHSESQWQNERRF